MKRLVTVLAAAGLSAALLMIPHPIQAQDQVEQVVAEAESAGIPEIAAEATILDEEGNVVREGSNEWTCMAHPGGPMCLDREWRSWLDAYVNQEDEVEVDELGIAYMLRGDHGVSNVDPFAQEPTPDNEWVTTGPHIMLVVPDPALLEGLPTDPWEGGPYVMWRDTPFVHVMIPLEEDGVQMHEMYDPDHR